MLTWPLEKNETLLWQGCPAPRCYLFRHWRSQLGAAFVLLFFPVLFWLTWQRDFSHMILALLLVPLFLAIVFGPLRLVYLRWRWETIFYAVTDRRLMIRCGKAKRTVSYPWAALQAIDVHPYADNLADIELTFADERPVVLECLEEPRTCLRVLPATPRTPLGNSILFDSDKLS